jgi:hypothetical protein
MSSRHESNKTFMLTFFSNIDLPERVNGMGLVANDPNSTPRLMELSEWKEDVIPSY